MLQKLLRLSNDGRRVYMSVMPKAKKNAPDLEKEQIDNWLKETGVSEFYRFEETINDVILKINSSTSSESRSDDVVIAESRDATVIASLDKEKMTAFLRIDGAYGGNPIKGNDLLDALKASEVIRGVKKQTLQKLFTASARLKPGEFLEVPVALGKLPVPGDDSKLLYYVQDSKSRVLKPRERSDGTVDMRDLGLMITVYEGQPLAKLVPPTTGIDGFNVAGEILPTTPGKYIKIRIYSGSKYNEDDPNIIIAEISGMPILHPDGVEVDNALCMKSVSVATGHINFEGSVVINGDVQPGMKVQATGSITVGGVVESGMLDAGGDIVIYNGILGRQEHSISDISTIIKSKGSIVAKFAQYAKIIAEKNIFITQHAMHCQTFTKGNLHVCDKSKRNGTLSGGEHVACGGVRVVNLGAPSGVHTKVQAFTDLAELLSEGAKIQKDLTDEQELLSKVKEAELKMMQAPENKRSEELIERLAWTKTHHFERISELKFKMETRFLQLDTLYRKHSIQILSSCYPGVECQLGENSFKITNEHGPCRLITSGRSIHLEPL